MPTVSKNDVLEVVGKVWGFPGATVEDEAKRALAEALIEEAWQHRNKSGIEVNQAGSIIKSALGSEWLSTHDRQTQGKPSLAGLLRDDPYFLLRNEEGHKQPMVRLRITRLSKLIENPELIAEYRASGADSTESSQHSHAQHEGQVTLTDDGLPIRPGQRPCAHYMKFGWCLFKQDCWYSHPPNNKRAGKAFLGSTGSSRDPPLFESDLEPGVMLINGVYPIRPNRKPCSFFLSNGWCAYKAKCRNNHPLPSELSALQAHLVVPSRAGAVSPMSDDSFAGSFQEGEEAPMVKQPPLQVLLGVIIDSVWPPRQSAQACAKGGLAKWILEQKAAEVQHCLLDREAEVTVPGPAAGQALNEFWQRQKLHNCNVKPYKSGLANFLEEDPLFWANRTASSPNTFTLRLGQLITDGAKAASSQLAAMCDKVWVPDSGKDAWLRGSLAKWLLQAGFEGNNGEVLRQVLAVGPDSPTVFRIDVAQAGEYLRRCWATNQHPYDKSTQPWVQLKPLIADDRFFYIEPAPGKPTSQHVTLDLLDMLRQLPKIASTAYSTRLGVHAAANGSAAHANGAGPSGSGASTGQARPSSRRSSAPGDVLDIDDEEAEGAANANGFVVMLQASSAAEAAVQEANGSHTVSSSNMARSSSTGFGSTEPSNSARSSTHSVSSTPQLSVTGGQTYDNPNASAEADIAALEALSYMPPAEGSGARKMQRWWPRNRPDQQGFVWTEIAVRLIAADGEDAAQRVAEMVQHLELCPILAVACSAYAQRPHLLQFFAPLASIGSVHMPAAVYLLDIHKPGPDVRNYMDLVAPVLSSRDIIKVCHSSKQWSGLLSKVFGLRLNNYFDTQQANYVFKALLRETGKRPSADADLQRTSEVSLTALLDNGGFYHPIRHQENVKLQWQNRPLTDELITCAAADVTYLIPLMETQVRTISQKALEVRQHQSQQRGRGSLLSSLPQELADMSVIDTLAKGVGDGSNRGSVSLQKLHEWVSMDVFYQEPWHRINE